MGGSDGFIIAIESLARAIGY